MKDLEVYPYRVGLAIGVKRPDPTIMKLKAASAAGNSGTGNRAALQKK